MGMYARARFPDTKKTIFQSRAMLGRYCNGAPQKWPNWGTEFGAENSADCGRLGRPPDERSPRFLIRQALGRMQYIERMIEELDKERLKTEPYQKLPLMNARSALLI